MPQMGRGEAVFMGLGILACIVLITILVIVAPPVAAAAGAKGTTYIIGVGTGLIL